MKFATKDTDRDYTGNAPQARDERVLERVRSLVTNAQDCLDGSGTEKRFLFVTGGPGTGKTTSIRSALSNLEKQAANVLSVMVPPNCSGKELDIEILRTMGAQVDFKASQWALFEDLKRELRERNILVLHLDEAEHLMPSSKGKRLRIVYDRLKNLAANPEWPVHIIFSGHHSLTHLLADDPLFSRRAEVVRL